MSVIIFKSGEWKKTFCSSLGYPCGKPILKSLFQHILSLPICHLKLSLTFTAVCAVYAYVHNEYKWKPHEVQYSCKVFWLKGMSVVKSRKVTYEEKWENIEKIGVCIFSPNLVTDEAQSLLTVVTELPELIWSPTALSKLKWEAMKIQVQKKGRKEAIKDIYCFLALKISSPTCKPSKIPHTPRATCEKASYAPHRPDSSVETFGQSVGFSHLKGLS